MRTSSVRCSPSERTHDDPQSTFGMCSYRGEQEKRHDSRFVSASCKRPDNFDSRMADRSVWFVKRMNRCNPVRALGRKVGGEIVVADASRKRAESFENCGRGDKPGPNPKNVRVIATKT
ncbi:hypothetical protein EP7_003274 [Isosphaeraceae bacterium EP7]